MEVAQNHSYNNKISSISASNQNNSLSNQFQLRRNLPVHIDLLDDMWMTCPGHAAIPATKADIMP
jgi:hypothetical protein